MSNEKEKMIQRIKSLMKHADSAKEIGSLAEAETFTAKVNQLLLEYNIEMMEVIAAADKNDDEFKNWQYSEAISYKDNQSGQRWRLSLVSTLCRHNLCSYTFNSYGKTFNIYGHMQNVDAVVWMYNFLAIGLLRLAQEHHVALPAEQKLFYNRYAYLKDFLLGAVRGIDEKLEAERVKHAHDTKMTGLIKVNKDALERYLKETNPNIKTVNFKQVSVGSGYNTGLEAGRNYSIGGGLNRSADKPQLRQQAKQLSN